MFQNKRFFSLVVSIFLIYSLGFGQTNLSLPVIKKSKSVSASVLRKQFKDWTLYAIDVKPLLAQARQEEKIHLQMGFEVAKLDATLRHSNIFGKNYRLTGAPREKGKLPPVPLTGSGVRLTVNDDFLYGWYAAGDKLYYLEPLWYFDAGAPKNEFVVYEASDVIQDAPKTCAVDDRMKVSEDITPPAQPEAPLQDCYQVDIAVASDYSMYQKYGTVGDVENRNIGVMNNVQTNYSGEFNWDFILNISTQYVVTTAGGDPWTSSTDPYVLLDDFNAWGNNGGFGTTDFDIGELWSDRDFDGSTIGLAFIGVVCGYSRYHVLQDFSNNAEELRVLTAHEMGHNFGAHHDPDGSPHIMAPTVSTSTTWSNQSKTEINTFAQGLIGGCLPMIACPGSASGPPIPSFTGTPTTICEGGSVTFTDQSTNNPQVWQWSFPGGTPNSFNGQNPPPITYNTAGTYDVSLTVSNLDGSNTGTISNYITVEQLPVASFTPNPNGLLVVFVNTTNPPATSYFWDFGDGNTSSDVSPTHVYASDGVYIITLTATNSCGSDVYTHTLSVNTPATADFTSDVQSGCTPLTVHFTSTSSANAVQWQWTFPGGTPSSSTEENPVVTYNSAGTYDVTLVASSPGGADTETKQNYITVTQSPTPDFTYSVSGNTVTFTNTTSPTSGNTYSWDFGDGNTSSDTNPMHTYATAGTYTVTLTVNNTPCGTFTTSQTIEMVQAPTANFIAPVTQGCVSFGVSFNDLSTNNPTSWQWSFPGGTPNSFNGQNPPTIFYNAPGVYDVTLTVSNAAGSDTQTKSAYITVSDSPTASFTFSVSGNTVSFTNTSPSMPGNSYLWNFGDGNTSTDVNPTHTYANPGSYTVTLLVSNFCGSSQSTQTVDLTPPVADFNSAVTTGCASFGVVFNDLSTNNPTSWQWSFPGGNPSSFTGQNPPTIFYDTPGTYDVSLTVSNASGTDTETKTGYITVLTAPVASFTSSLSGNTVSFTSTSTGSPTGYSWNFGDPASGSANTSTQANPSHTYATDGTYTVTLTVTNQCGSNTTTQTVTISANTPSVSIDAFNSPICVGNSVSFNATVSSNTQNVEWTFEGGTPATSTAMNPTVTYNSPGTFNVSVTAFNGSNSSTATASIVVLPTAIANFVAGTSGLTVNLTNTSTNAASYVWDFGDGNTSTDFEPSHTYTADGTYTVCLIATNSCGSDTTCQPVTISGNGPTANIVADKTSGCEPLTINYHADVSANTTSVSWNFQGGSPATSSAIDVAVTYNTPGTYLTTLTATNPSGSSMDNLQIVIQPKPTANFSEQINGPDVQFNNLSTGNPTSYAWDFGDGNTSTDENPAHTYGAPGTYQVCLTATNNCGSDIQCGTVQIDAWMPTAEIETTTPTTGCEPLNVSFHANVSNANSILWTFDGGSPATSTATDVTVTFNSPGTHTVTLSATNSYGTTTAPQESITVQPLPVANFTVNVSGYLVTTNNLSQNATSYIWDFGDGTVLTGFNPGHLYTSDTVTTIILISTNDCGSDTTSLQVSIGSSPSCNPTASVTSGCAPLVVDFTANGTNVDTYSWTFDGGIPATSTEANPQVTFNAPGTHTATLTVSNSLGSSTNTVNVTVLAPTQAGFTYTINDHTVTFTSTSQNETNLIWNFGDGNTATNSTTIDHTYSDGTYTPFLIATGPCNNDTVWIDNDLVFSSTQAPTAVAEASVVEGCAPLEVELSAQNTNADSYSWTISGGNPSTSNNQTVTTVFQTVGTYQVVLTVSNAIGTDTDTLEIVVQNSVEAMYTISADNLTLTFTNQSQYADSYFWDFGDGATSTESDPVHTYPGGGNYNITMIASNSCSNDTITRNVVITGLEDPLGELDILLTPNPGDGLYYLSVNAPQSGQISLQIFDVLGRRVWTKDWGRTRTVSEAIDLLNFAAGNYIFRLRFDDRIMTGKIIKLR